MCSDWNSHSSRCLLICTGVFHMMSTFFSICQFSRYLEITRICLWGHCFLKGITWVKKHLVVRYRRRASSHWNHESKAWKWFQESEWDSGPHLTWGCVSIEHDCLENVFWDVYHFLMGIKMVQGQLGM